MQFSLLRLSTLVCVCNQVADVVASLMCGNSWHAWLSPPGHVASKCQASRHVACLHLLALQVPSLWEGLSELWHVDPKRFCVIQAPDGLKLDVCKQLLTAIWASLLEPIIRTKDDASRLLVYHDVSAVALGSCKRVKIMVLWQCAVKLQLTAVANRCRYITPNRH